MGFFISQSNPTFPNYIFRHQNPIIYNPKPWFREKSTNCIDQKKQRKWDWIVQFNKGSNFLLLWKLIMRTATIVGTRGERKTKVFLRKTKIWRRAEESDVMRREREREREKKLVLIFFVFLSVFGVFLIRTKK